MTRQSAGILMYRTKNKQLQVLLVHPGGPFWAKKDLAAWSIPKGEFDDTEEALQAAIREFEEETGMRPEGDFKALNPVKSSGKTVFAFAVEGDFNPEDLKSNSFSIEWPPKSGKKQDYPEVDRAEWFDTETAKEKIHTYLKPLLNQIASG